MLKAFQFLQRGIFVYIVLFFVFKVVVNEDRLRIKALNHLMPPSFDHFIDVVENGKDKNEGKFKDYRRYFKDLTQYIPYNPAGHGLRAYCAYQLGKEKEAKEYFEKAIKQNPNFLWFLYNLGWMSYTKGEYKEAINYFEQARNTILKDNFLFIFKSKAYFPIFKRYEGREKELQAKLEKRMVHGYEKSYRALVLSHFKRGDFDKVLSLSREGMNPNFKNQEFFLYYAGVALYELGQNISAGKYLEQTIKRNPKNQDAVRYLGLIMQRLKREESAQSFFNRAKQLDQLQDQGFDVETGLDIQIY